MRRFQVVSIIVAAAILGGAAVVGAQSERSQKRTVVVPQEVIIELQKLARDSFGDVAWADLSRDLTRVMRDLGRELGHIGGDVVGHGLLVQDRDFQFEQTDRQTKTLAIGASGSLELRNVVGDISVKAGGTGEASVEIVRVSRGRTDADAKRGLERVVADVSTRGDRGSVVAEYPNERRPNYAVSVALTVTAPAGTRVSVHSVTGDVTISGIRGVTSVNTTTGAVEISQASALASAHSVTGTLTIRDSEGDAVDIGTMSGQVRLNNVKARRLEVSAVSSGISARGIQAGGAEVTCVSGSIEYSGPVVAGGRYEFQAHSGEVRLALTGGFDFEGQTFAGQVDADPSLGLKPQAGTERAGFAPRRSMVRGMVGGGGAAVEATSFSGHIRLVRALPDSPATRGRGR